jgi:hypothetical protein
MSNPIQTAAKDEVQLCAYKGGCPGRPMSKAREYHLIDLVGTSHGGFQTLAGARQFAREEGLRAWDIFHGDDRIEYHDPDDRKRSDVKEKQDLWMCLLLNAPTNQVPS